jgi:hypothetical protein
MLKHILLAKSSATNWLSVPATGSAVIDAMPCVVQLRLIKHCGAYVSSLLADIVTEGGSDSAQHRYGCHVPQYGEGINVTVSTSSGFGETDECALRIRFRNRSTLKCLILR